MQRFFPPYPDSPAPDSSSFSMSAVLSTSGTVRPAYLEAPGRRSGADLCRHSKPSGIPISFQCVDDNSDFPSIGTSTFLPSSSTSGYGHLHGWALDENLGGVQRVVFRRRNLLGVATYGFARTDVQTANPNIANSINSGCASPLIRTPLSDSRHPAERTGDDAQGRQTVIGRRTFCGQSQLGFCLQQPTKARQAPGFFVWMERGSCRWVAGSLPAACPPASRQRAACDPMTIPQNSLSRITLATNRLRVAADALAEVRAEDRSPGPRSAPKADALEGLPAIPGALIVEKAVVVNASMRNCCEKTKPYEMWPSTARSARTEPDFTPRIRRAPKNPSPYLEKRSRLRPVEIVELQAKALERGGNALPPGDVEAMKRFCFSSYSSGGPTAPSACGIHIHRRRTRSNPSGRSGPRWRARQRTYPEHDERAGRFSAR